MDAKVIDVAVGKLVPAPWQRGVDEKSEKFKDLLAAVKADGVRKALDVRPRGGCDEDGYEVLDGGRRLRAATIAKLKAVPCIVHSGLTDAEACDLTYLAFLGREDLTPLQEGKAIAELLERHGGDAEAVASVVGKTVRWVRMRANLRWLTKKWHKLAADASWTAAHLALVARLPAAVQDDLIKTDYDYEQRCEDSVKELAARINEKYLRLLSKAPWNLDDATLVPEMGACSACTQRSSQEGLLFHEADELEP
ncbi:MAG: ParB N-terminal domain-containing protein, partial [Planctomycetota bacterium]